MRKPVVESCLILYKANSMRHLLALVALISGLAALTAPDQARAGAIENAMMEMAEHGAHLSCVTPSQREGATHRPSEKKKKRAAPRQRRSVTLVIPGFQLGSDRALE